MTVDSAAILVVGAGAGAGEAACAQVPGLLREAGFAVATAGDGADALHQFGAGRFVLVLLDAELPDASGYDICARMRAQAGPLLPILMVTGSDDVGAVERAFQSGATDFVCGPFNPALIGYRVKYLLRGHATMMDLRAEQARNAALLQAIPDLMFEMDLSGRHLECHSPRSDLLALPVERLLGRTVSEVMPPLAAQTWLDALQEAHATGSSTGRQVELQLARGTFWFELSVSRKATQEGQDARFIVLSRDITQRKEAETKILRLAYFDGLTRLPNRQSFLQRVDREIKRAQHDGSQLGVLFMDLDGFKNINDTLGHAVGDHILQRAANRLRQGVRPADLVSRPVDLELRGAEPGAEVEFARLGGDEFTALILDLKGPEGALVVSRRILELMRRPYALDGRDLLLTASIGIALYPEDGLDAATLLKHADTAMYHAKDSGRDNCQFYSASLTNLAVQRMELERDMRVALERAEFSLDYQPVLELATGRIHAVEALLRWSRPGHGEVLPQEFIPVAERSGLILDIGRWVLRTACVDAARWQQGGHPVRLAVNLSPLQFKDPELAGIVRDALAHSGLAPELLEVELTESAVMADTEATMRTLGALREIGVRFALDDFGTGYSSLSHLKRMPLNTLKVDRSFVAGLPGDGENQAIVRAILAMAASLGLAVTAEGVETTAQAQALQAMACDAQQGHFFSRPVKAPLIPALLERHWTPQPAEPS